MIQDKRGRDNESQLYTFIYIFFHFAQEIGFDTSCKLSPKEFFF